MMTSTRKVLRPTAADRGYGSVWRRARKLFLVAHPLCVACRAEGRRAPAQVVDHVMPHRGDLALFWDRGNWQALCTTCHNRKTGNGE